MTGMTAFVLDALIKLNDSDFKKGLDKAEKSFKGVGEKLGKVGNGIKAIGGVAVASIGAAAGAIGKLTLDAVNAYANYEQLEGGIKTLFGTGERTLEEYQKSIGITEKSTQKQIDASIEKYHSLERAQADMMDKAHKAFKTAGVDANTYMENVTSFSAALIKSVGGDTEKAVELADQAMTDMADNSNKMGTDLQSIQNAYQGFAKGNFTMLDNLKLGYGGTRSEMQRLLKDAEKIQKQNGKNVKYNIKNLDDIYDALHVVQTEMGITGTTAEEAGTTIQGSTNMMKAAWTNLKIAMVDPKGNIGQAITDLTESIKVAAKNWVPAIKQALIGLGSVVKELAPVLAKELPGLIDELLPGVLSAAAQLAASLAQGLIMSLPTLLSSIGDIFGALLEVEWPSWDDIKEAAGKAWEKIKEGLKKLGGAVFGTKEDGSVDWPTWEDVKEKAGEVWKTIKQGAVDLGGLVFGKKEDGSVDWPTWEDVKEAASKAWDAIKTGIEAIVKWAVGTPEMPTANEVGKKVKEWWDGLVSTIEGLLKWVFGAPEPGDSTGEATKTKVQNWWDNIVKPLLKGVIDFVLGVFGLPSVDEMVKAVETWWTEVTAQFANILNYILSLFGLPPAEEMKKSVEEWWTEVKKLISSVLTYVLGLFGLPSFEEMVKKIKEWWEDVKKNVVLSLTATVNIIKSGSEKGADEWDDDSGEFDEFAGAWEDYHRQAKGNWTVPYDDYPSLLHRNEMVLTASQARRYKESGSGSEVNFIALTAAVADGIRQGMAGAQVNSYLDGKALTDEVSRILGNNLASRRFA